MNKNVLYNLRAARISVFSGVSLAIRHKMYNVLENNVDLATVHNVLDVGVTSDKEQIESNFFEAWFPDKSRITALSNQDASWLEVKYPGLKFIKGDGCSMPFQPNSFDLVFSNAVLEHVGSSHHQKKFIGECFRVAKQWVFLTTPNRCHPLELHTVIPFLHWLPKSLHRKILSSLGIDYLSREENLNLLTKRELLTYCEPLLSSREGVAEIYTVNFLGIPSNLLLLIKKYE
jgi:hypothetical protein